MTIIVLIYFPLFVVPVVDFNVNFNLNMESKKRDLWSDREIKEMLSIINEKHVMQLIDGKVKRNKNIFADIAKQMKKKNILKSDVQIRTKFKSLKSDFYNAKRSNNQSGAKRQTSEQFDLLDAIFGHRPALETVGVDTIEMDKVDETDIIPSMEDADLPYEYLAEEETSFVSSQDEQPSTSKSQGFKRTKKNSYQKVVETFTNEWKDSQEDMINKLREQDEIKAKRHEGIMEKSTKAMKEMLEEDRKETSKLFQHFLNALQPAQPYSMFQPHQFFAREQSLHTPVILPKFSPPENEEGL